MDHYQRIREKLQSALPEGYKDNVYISPPGGTKLNYPCIIYDVDDVDKIFADDIPFVISKRYRVMVIDRDPESPTSDALLAFAGSSFTTKYEKDGLSHFIHNIFL